MEPTGYENLSSRAPNGVPPPGTAREDSVRLQGGDWTSSTEKLPGHGQPDPVFETGPDCHAQLPELEENCFVIDLKRYILLELGYPNVEVELCDEHLERAINDALSDFARQNAFNAMRYWRIKLTPYQTTYDVPPDLRVVRDIQLLRFNDWNQIFGSDVLINPLYMRNTSEAYQDILTFWLSEATFETWRRVYGLQISWDLFEGGKLINIYPVPNHSDFMIIKGTYNVTLKDIDDRALGTKDELFRRLALAHAMIILGRIRSKYPAGINGSQGAIQLDGQDRLAEGKEMLADARLELRNSGKPVEIFTG